MTESAHTPGPWRSTIARRTDNAIIAAHVVSLDGTNIAQLAIHSDDICEANGRLIAAAPELLGALETALEEMSTFLRERAATAKARAAIAKATGETTSPEDPHA